MTPLHLHLLAGKDNVPGPIWNSSAGTEYRADLVRIGLMDADGRATAAGMDWLDRAASTPIFETQEA